MNETGLIGRAIGKMAIIRELRGAIGKIVRLARHYPFGDVEGRIGNIDEANVFLRARKTSYVGLRRNRLSIPFEQIRSVVVLGYPLRIVR